MPSFCPEANRIKKDERSLILLVLAWSVGQVRAADISWNTGNGTWNTLELNWTGDTNRFTDGGVDNVSFLGSGGGTVTVDIGMTPLSTIVDNDSGTYAFQGVAGSIDGGSLTKDGSGELELNTVHLLLTAGDNVKNIHQLCGAGKKACVKPYLQLIERYPELFRSVPFMPVLGNHDKQIRPRGNKPPSEPVYDIEATAFRRFFELPGDRVEMAF